MEIDNDAIIEGVQKAMTEVLEGLQHSGYRNYLAELITEGVTKATRDWLDENEDRVLAAIQAAHTSDE